MAKPDYNQKIYDFIKSQTSGLQYVYSRDCNASFFKSMAESYYGFNPSLPIGEWEQAFTWAMADVFGGGCEVEPI